MSILGPFSRDILLINQTLFLQVYANSLFLRFTYWLYFDKSRWFRVHRLFLMNDDFLFLGLIILFLILSFHFFMFFYVDFLKDLLMHCLYCRILKSNSFFKDFLRVFVLLCTFCYDWNIHLSYEQAALLLWVHKEGSLLNVTHSRLLAFSLWCEIYPHYMRLMPLLLRPYGNFKLLILFLVLKKISLSLFFFLFNLYI